MMGLLVFKEQLKTIYAKYSYLVMAGIKFVVSYMSFYMINQNIGFMSRLKSPVIVLLLSLVCSVLPYSAVAITAAGFMLAHIYMVSFETALLTAVFLIIIMMLYYGFQPGDSYLLLLTPLLFMFRVPYVIPLLVGLGGGLASAIPVGCGVILYYIVMYVKQNAGILTNDSSIDITQKYVQIINALLANHLMIIMIMAFVFSILVVYLIKKLSVDYAWIIAVIAGTITQLVVIFIGSSKYNVTVSMGALLLGIIISALISAVYQFFVFAVDYSRTEYTQFEDDDYYYYVKAVPKMTVSKPDVKVQKISTRRTPRTRRN